MAAVSQMSLLGPCDLDTWMRREAHRRRSRPERTRPPLSIEAAIGAELNALGGADVSPFDVHSHTGADVDGSARSAEEHVLDLQRIGGRSVI